MQSIHVGFDKQNATFKYKYPSNPSLMNHKYFKKGLPIYISKPHL